MNLLKNSRLKEIFLHIIVWMAILSFLVFDHNDFRIMDSLLRLIFPFGLFYFNYFILAPKLLLNKDKNSYQTLIYVGVVLVIIFVGAYIQSEIVPKPRMQMQGMRVPPNPDMFKERGIGFRIFPFVMIMVLHISVSSLLRMYSSFNELRQKQSETETEKKTAELNFLKAQLNPHFFFNSLNTIYSLSIKQSASTPEAVLNLSNLMRYMLYETNKDKVRLEDEIEYIESYIELQKLRLPKNNKIFLDIYGSTNGILIPPLLFISFIENAFKHGISPNKVNFISIDFAILKNELRFVITNGIFRKDSGTKGMGIENTRKRMELYFPDKHKLDIYEEDEKFKVELIIYLDENQDSNY